MESRVILYWLLAGLAFTLTQPGTIAFANWDAPYGFYKDLSVWLASAGAFLILVAAHGLVQWKEKRLGLIHPIGAGILAIATLLLGYWAEGFIRGEMGYGTGGFVGFVISGLIGLFLALMLLPGAFLALIAGELYYPYDRPLLRVWFLSLAVSVVLIVAYFKIWREEIRGRDNPAP